MAKLPNLPIQSMCAMRFLVILLFSSVSSATVLSHVDKEEKGRRRLRKRNHGRSGASTAPVGFDNVPILDVVGADRSGAAPSMPTSPTNPSITLEDQNRENLKSNDSNTTYLLQADFDKGTYRITKPGRYIFLEDITFQPNPPSWSRRHGQPVTGAEVASCCRPTKSQLVSRGGTYPDKPYQLGFFSALTVETRGVEIDLAGHKFEQSEEHALVQRFFALITLANTPFIVGQGPAGGFGTEHVSGKDVHIHGGTLGRSSHHGIHGNDAENVRIHDIEFVDFEVAAVALNGVNGLDVRDCTATSRKDVPILGLWSAGLFIQPLIKELENTGSTSTLTVQGVTKTAADIRAELEETIANAYKDIILGSGWIDPWEHPLEHGLYHNPAGMSDGNAYGFLTNHIGIAINGFPSATARQPARNVYFKNVTVSSLAAAIRETVGLRLSLNGKAMVDPHGSMLQLMNAGGSISNSDHKGHGHEARALSSELEADEIRPMTISDLINYDKAVYTGNPVANAQLLASKAQQKGELKNFNPSTIQAEVIEWAENGRPLSELLLRWSDDTRDGFVCNGDSMAHVNKGVIGFKIDGTVDATLVGCRVNHLTNIGFHGSSDCGRYDTSLWGSTISGYGGAETRGFSMSGSVNVTLRGCTVDGALSTQGTSVGFDIMRDSANVKMEMCVQRGTVATGMGVDTPIGMVDAFGVRMAEGTKDCEVYQHCLKPPVSANGNSEEVMDMGQGNKILKPATICPFRR